MGGQEVLSTQRMMTECISTMQIPHQTATDKPVKPSGLDVKERFSNSSILSLLTRSYTRTAPISSPVNNSSSMSSNLSSKLSITCPSNFSNTGSRSNSPVNSATNSFKVLPVISTSNDRSPQKPPIRGREVERDTSKDTSKVSNLFSRFSINSNSPNVKKLSKIISKGPGSDVYQIGAEIGRGGYAVVYQALNVETGDFVAVKRIPLSAVDDGTLSLIQGEIELMQRLNHPHIVEYYDMIRSDGYLNIILEYIENGSLSIVLKSFGSFSEPLVAIYVNQILKGLIYLHEQGVLHRDIKAANILTTKDGIVKLADFGVAMRLNSKTNPSSRSQTPEFKNKSQDVAGSPYWIAPEIIEMATPTTACDIWSVGCTIIELLTGKPPYFSKPPMAALFSIVQDEYPPIPEGISPDIRDFLLLCFQKNPADRASAATLLKHPWLVSCQAQSASRSMITRSSVRSSTLDEDMGGVRVNAELEGSQFGDSSVRINRDRDLSNRDMRVEGAGNEEEKVDSFRRNERSIRRYSEKLGGSDSSIRMSSQDRDNRDRGVRSQDQNSERRVSHRNHNQSLVSSQCHTPDRNSRRRADSHRDVEKERIREKQTGLSIDMLREKDLEADSCIDREREKEKEREKERQKEREREGELGSPKPFSVSVKMRSRSIVDLSDRLSNRISRKPSTDSCPLKLPSSGELSLFETSYDGTDSALPTV